MTSIYTELLARRCYSCRPRSRHARRTLRRSRSLTTAELAQQVLGVLDASIDRADRALEIVDQARGPGALHYWTGMLRIDPSKDNNTFLLMLVALKIGEFVAMGLKDIYKMRRPAQVYPLIMPLIDGPDTPSFPSSHSMQAHLISGVLQLALAAHGADGVAAAGPAAAALLRTPRRPSIVLADRIAYNREVAGVHYRMDSNARLLRCRASAWPCSTALPAGSLVQAAGRPRGDRAARTCTSASIAPRRGETDAWSRARRG